MKVDRGTEWGTERALEGEGNRTRGGDGRKGKTHVACFLVHTHSLINMYICTYIHVYISTHIYRVIWERMGSARGGGRRQIVKGGYEQSTGAHTYGNAMM